jgi:hypothetical protein
LILCMHTTLLLPTWLNLAPVCLFVGANAHIDSCCTTCDVTSRLIYTEGEVSNITFERDHGTPSFFFFLLVSLHLCVCSRQ